MKKWFIYIFTLCTLIFNSDVYAAKYYPIVSTDDIVENDKILIVVDDNVLGVNGEDYLLLDYPSQVDDWTGFGAKNNMVTINSDGTIDETDDVDKNAFTISGYAQSVKNPTEYSGNLKISVNEGNSGFKYTYLYLSYYYEQKIFYRTNPMKIKIKVEKDGKISVRQSKTSYVRFEDGAWAISDDSTSRVTIYKLVSDESDINYVSYYDSDGNILRKTPIFSSTTIVDYSTVDEVMDNEIFLGWTTKKGSDNVEYNFGDTITESISLYPVVEKINNIITIGEMIIGTTTNDEADETNKGSISVVIHNGDEVTTHTIEYKYKTYNMIDLAIKFNYDSTKYSRAHNYLTDTSNFESANSILGSVYVTLDMATREGTEGENSLNTYGGYIDNVAGDSTIDIYVSKVYNVEYYINGVLSTEYTDNTKYVIDSSQLEQPTNYDNLTSYDNIEQGVIKNYYYNSSLESYSTTINVNDSYNWYIKSTNVSGQTISVKDFIPDEGNTIIIRCDDNPKTGLIKYYQIIISVIIIGATIIVIINKKRLFRKI